MELKERESVPSLRAFCIHYICARIDSYEKQIVEDLNYDLHLQLYEYFHARGSVNDHVINRTIYSDQDTLDFSECVMLSNSSLLSLMERTGSTLKSLSFKECSKISDSGLQHLSQGAPNLRTLNLSGCFLITHHGLSTLSANCTSLTSLDLSGCIYLSDKGVVPIITNMTNLRILNLRDCNRVTWNIEIEKGTTFPNMKCLCLSKTGISDLSIALISLPFPELSILDVSWCDALTNVALKFIGARLLKLQSLNLWGLTSITNKGLELVLQRCTQITSLAIADCDKLTDEIILSAITYLPSLKKMNLWGCTKISDGAVQLLTKYQTELEALGLSYGGFGAASLALAGVKLPKLASLDCAGCDLSDRVLQSLSEASGGKGLSEINLKKCRAITSEGLDGLLEANLKCLTMVNLAGCVLLAKSSVLTLAKCRQLKSVVLSANPAIDDEVVFELVKGLKERLEVLNLDACERISNQAIDYILQKCQLLNNLSLCFCSQLGDEAFQSLSWVDSETYTNRFLFPIHLWPGSNLKTISLWGCNFSDITLRRLARACKKLRSVDVPYNLTLTDLSCMEIAAHCPNIHSLNIACNLLLSEASVLAVVRCCINLSALDVSHTKFGDGALEALQKHSFALQTLNLSYCNNMTMPAILELVKACPSIKNLKVRRDANNAFSEEETLQLSRDEDLVKRFQKLEL